jgi:hypothetical protein
MRSSGPALAALLLPLAAAAGGPDSVPLSPEAALTAGAVLASDDVGGGGWYNPASLGAVTRSSIQVGASAYTESYTFISEATRASVPWADISGNIRSLNYTSVPAVLSYSYKLRDGLGLSIGVWTPYHAYEGGTTTIASSGPYPATPTPLNATFTETYSFSDRRDDTWAGVAVGWQATPTLRLGAMLQGSYSTDVQTVDVTTSLQTTSTNPNESGGHVVYSERRDQGLLGLRTLFGLQYDATPEVRLAAAVRGPAFRVVAWGPHNTFFSSAALLPGVPPTQFQTSTQTTPERGIELVEPVTFFGGLRVRGARWTLAVEGDWHSQLTRQISSFKEGGSVRLGWTWRVDADLLVGVGLFQDNRSTEASGGKTAMSYAGFTGGALYRPSAVVRALAGSHAWDLLTAVAIRGAYGWGEYKGLSLDPGVGQAVAVTFPDAPVSAVEGSISFFTAIIF